MISFGQSFAAKKGLRMEAFGENHELKIQIGDFVSFGEHVHLGAVNKITIEDNVLLGSRIIIIDHNHGKYNGENQSSPNEIPAKRVLFSAGPIIIRKNVWICDGAVILNNVTIGEGSIVAANTIVSKNVEAYTIVGGNPMKILKRYNFQSQKWE